MRWITTQDLETWGESIPARSELPDLVEALILASARAVRTRRFPKGDKAEIHGFDGYLVAEGVPNIPDGESFWELSTEEKYIQKAESELRTRRSEQIPDARRAEAAFVFVTPRAWQGSEEREVQRWRAERKAEYGWKEVVVIDGVMLEGWLDQCSAVAARYARQWGLAPQSGARGMDEFWEEYRLRFGTPLTEPVLLCQREEQSKSLVAHLRPGSGAVVLRADSPDEAIAFAVAAIRSAEQSEREYLEARTLVLDSDDAARHFSGRSDLIFIHGPAVTIGHRLAATAPTISCVGRDRPDRTGYMSLERPTTDAFAEAIKTMRVPEERARLLARASGRSVTILRRVFPNGDAPLPEWVGAGRRLIAALLAGAWDAGCEGDKRILCGLAGTGSYEECEQQVREFQSMQDAPIDREGTVWKIRAPVDAFVHLAHLLGQEDFRRLEAAVIEVFSEIDQSLNAPPPDISFNPPRPRYSSWLRDGLATTLLQIAVHHEGAELNVPGTTPQAFVDALISGLPGLSSDWRLIASLRAELPSLAEAAPRPFLRALEALLEGDGRALRPIFREGGLFSPFSPHTYVLWALEVLAWDPVRLTETSLILAKLASLDPGGRIANRPINSLTEIFMPWHPDTNAPQQQRLATLDLIVREVPEVGWKLIFKLLPTMHSVGQLTDKPKYREAGSSDREVLTEGMLTEAYRAIIQKALALADDDAERWVSLIPGLPNFDPALRAEAYNLIERCLETADGEHRRQVWSALRDELNRHRAFKDAKWALPSEEQERISLLVDRFAPSEVIKRVAWLFDNAYPNLPTRRDDWHRAAVEARASALMELLKDSGMAGVLRLVDSVKMPELVAPALESVAENVGVFDNLLEAALARQEEKFERFAAAISVQAVLKFPEQWCDLIRDRARKGELSNERFVSLLLHWPEKRSTWDFVASLGREVERNYWSRKQAWPINAADESDLLHAAQRYLDVGRAVAVVNALGKGVASLPRDLAFRVLDLVVTELNKEPAAATGMLTYQLEQILDALEENGKATTAEIARTEWALFPLFEHGQRALRLHRVMLEDPNFYVSLFCAVFRAEGEEPSEPTAEERNRATAAYRLLRSFSSVPGVDKAGVDSNRLRSWVLDVKRLGEEAKRSVLTYQHIGQVLAHAPNDSTDQAWPHMAVRDLIEELSSDEVERGIRVERFNMRGAYSKALFEGGKKERAFAEAYRDWAKTAARWPRTASLLNEIARNWDHHADREDAEARKERMRD